MLEPDATLRSRSCSPRRSPQHSWPRPRPTAWSTRRSAGRCGSPATTTTSSGSPGAPAGRSSTSRPSPAGVRSTSTGGPGVSSYPPGSSSTSGRRARPWPPTWRPARRGRRLGPASSSASAAISPWPGRPQSAAGGSTWPRTPPSRRTPRARRSRSTQAGWRRRARPSGAGSGAASRFTTSSTRGPGGRPTDRGERRRSSPRAAWRRTRRRPPRSSGATTRPTGWPACASQPGSSASTGRSATSAAGRSPWWPPDDWRLPRRRKPIERVGSRDWAHHLGGWTGAST